VTRHMERVCFGDRCAYIHHDGVVGWRVDRRQGDGRDAVTWHWTLRSATRARRAWVDDGLVQGRRVA
jgi:hypothetical protein